ncbi:MAG: protein-L-isoaspartate(D-aspartate) O-methyltransferase [Alphaproteobacteria bacterium]|jgi:protein-L-isoaspartate(D-aspartate) O-methyltransferase|nr:protein-L-isoaspartate(D-aspartate) O-methyltransferase [Alphaproteobacteria bacterium]MBT7942075.1 protein-L-isoaspartate(D-aspartate) O-methyltransferase [Alphaproteobacteria bacterium]
MVMGLFGNDDQARDKARDRLVAEIETNARETANWTGRSKFSDAVMAAITRVPRHEFVRPGDEAAAYANRPQSIGFGQTISQPYIVALMSDLLDISPGCRVLEIGTGSGYQTAVLAELGADVFSMEAVDALAGPARDRLAGLGYDTVRVISGDGFEGWPVEDPPVPPFDAIIVTAAPERTPEALVDQLGRGGRMVIPLGRAHETQFLTLITKDEAGGVREQGLLPVAFVPMVKKVSD